MCVPWPSWRRFSGSSMAEGGPNMLRIVSAVIAENRVPLISPRYKFTIATSGAAFSARTPSASRHPSQINAQAAQADLPLEPMALLILRGGRSHYSASLQGHASRSSYANGPLPSLTDDLFAPL